jgi:hypothetical protein
LSDPFSGRHVNTFHLSEYILYSFVEHGPFAAGHQVREGEEEDEGDGDGSSNRSQVFEAVGAGALVRKKIAPPPARLEQKYIYTILD